MVVKLPSTGSSHPDTLPKQVSVWNKNVVMVSLMVLPLATEAVADPVLLRAVSLDGLKKSRRPFDSVPLSLEVASLDIGEMVVVDLLELCCLFNLFADRSASLLITVLR